MKVPQLYHGLQFNSISHYYHLALTFTVRHSHLEWVQALMKKVFLARVGWLKNLYTKLERLTLSCRVTWAWSERVNLYNRQIIPSEKTKTYAT